MLDRVDQTRTDEALERLTSLISQRNLQPGDRLPPERELLSLLNLGRGALRRALERLERSGVIWRHVGKGTFIAHRSDAATERLSDLGHQMTPVRMMRARLVVEPAIAREAALNASGEAIARIRSAMERARAAASWAEYERQDDRLHRAVAEAADNLLLLALYDDLNRVQREVAGGTVRRATSRPPADHTSFAEHEAILHAVEAHDAEEAFRAMHRHLASVSARLFGPA